PNSGGKASGATTTGAPSSSATALGPAATGAPIAQGQIQLVPAISDADGPDHCSYAYEWNKGDEEDRRKQMLTLATEQLRAYLNNREKLTTEAEAAPKAKGGARKSAPKTKAAEPVFDRTEVRTFDLW